MVRFYRLRKRGFRPLTFWRPNRGARLLSNLIPLLDLPDAASSNKTRFIRSLGDKRCRSQKIASDTLCGVCRTHAHPLILGRRPCWLRWLKLGKDLPSEKHMPETVTPVPFLSWIAATDCLLVPGCTE